MTLIGVSFNEEDIVTQSITKTPNTSVSRDVEQVIEKITNTWNKAAEYIIEVSKMLKDLSEDDQKKWYAVRDELMKRKIMSRTTISNLIKIAKTPLLVSNVDKLPPAYNTLWELSKLPKAELQSKFKNNLIKPELRLEDARKWSKSKKAEIPVYQVEVEVTDRKKCIIISISDDYVNEHHEDIEGELLKIKMSMKYASVDAVGTLKRKIAGD